MFSKINLLIKISFLALLAFALTGCGPVYETSYSYKPPKNWAGRKCTNRCLSRRSFCNMRCRRNYNICRSDALEDARPEFRAYVREQRHQRLPIVKSLSDFADFGTCQRGCGCTINYRQCYSNCGGQVITHRVCVAFCDKVRKSPQ